MKTLVDDNLPEPQPEPKKKDNTALNLVIIAGLILLALVILNKYFKDKE